MVFNYQGFNSSRKLTLMFLNGNHTMSSCFCTRLVFLSSTTYISIVGLNGSVVIHNMDVAFPYVFQLTIDNILFHNGGLHASNIQKFTLYSVKLIEHGLFVRVFSGELIKLQTYNSHVLVEKSTSNVTFTNCTFHDYSGGLFPGLIIRDPIQTAVTILYHSHVTFTGNSGFTTTITQHLFPTQAQSP